MENPKSVVASTDQKVSWPVLPLEEANKFSSNVYSVEKKCVTEQENDHKCTIGDKETESWNSYAHCADSNKKENGGVEENHISLPSLHCKENSSDAIVIINKALCANYRSDSENSSSSSTSSSLSSSSSLTSSLSEQSNGNLGEYSRNPKNNEIKKKHGFDSSTTEHWINNLPPIEELQISLPEQLCQEIGVITSIVDTLVVVESYKGTAALDVDTVLFLESGKKPLGKVFEILGPISEPIYAVRFNSSEEIIANKILKGLKVYYAPATQHTTFVLLSDVLKCRGSDASWKDNIEAPSEFQDFSDDEEERKFKNKNNTGLGDPSFYVQSYSRKRPFNNSSSIKLHRSTKTQNPESPWDNPPCNSPFVPRGHFRSQHFGFPLRTTEPRQFHSLQFVSNEFSTLPTNQNALPRFRLHPQGYGSGPAAFPMPNYSGLGNPRIAPVGIGLNLPPPGMSIDSYGNRFRLPPPPPPPPPPSSHSAF